MPKRGCKAPLPCLCRQLVEGLGVLSRKSAWLPAAQPLPGCVAPSGRRALDACLTAWIWFCVAGGLLPLPAAGSDSLLMTSLAYDAAATSEAGVEFRAFRAKSGAAGGLHALRFDDKGERLLWRAEERLAGMTPGERVILTYARGAAGLPFVYDRLNEAQRAVLDPSEVLWLRGLGNSRRLGPIIRSQPLFVGRPLAAGRSRAPYPTALGDRYADFANSFRQRRELVYVGANDGMLHAFAAGTGVEVFAYVPNKLIDGDQGFATRLDSRLEEPDRVRPLVDLTPTAEDVFVRSRANAGSKSWRTLLVGGLGDGGKGYFALDVTDPDASFRSAEQAAGAVLWEFTDLDDTYPTRADGQPLAGADGSRMRDQQGGLVKDLGYALSQARVGMSNAEGANGEKEWVVLFGNGHGSTAGSATLFVLFIDRGLDGWTAGEFRKLSSFRPSMAGGAVPNGLGEPALVDLDLNGTVDRAYAGDLQGNLHRFDLSDEAPSNWSASVIFQARNAEDDAAPLPITARPHVLKHPHQAGFMLVFGTGLGTDPEDQASAGIQSLFGIWDADEGKGRHSSAPVGQASLVRQRMTNIRGAADALFEWQRIVSKQEVRYRQSAAGRSAVLGWRLDFDAPRLGASAGAAEHPGEHVHGRLLAWDDLLFVTTVLPGPADGEGWLGGVLPISIMTGASPGRPVLDLNGDGELNDKDLATWEGRTYAPGILVAAEEFGGALVGCRLLPPGERSSSGSPLLVLAGGQERRFIRLGAPARLRQGRLSWRELTEFD